MGFEGKQTAAGSGAEFESIAEIEAREAAEILLQKQVKIKHTAVTELGLHPSADISLKLNRIHNVTSITLRESGFVTTAVINATGLHFTYNSLNDNTAAQRGEEIFATHKKIIEDLDLFST